mmetsp:Transcript_16585/g.35736  ORF Transcript_16585/g.35736 Transcript_16585/m.35736 type:complete len:360 (+) Transcript_16585:139-1218(+)
MIEYEPHDGYLATVFAISHSVLPRVICERTYIFFATLHMVLWWYKEDLIEAQPELKSYLQISWSAVSAVVAMSTFFLIFYANKIFERYTVIYEAVRRLLSGMMDFVLELKIHTAGGHEKWLHLCCRYLLASAYLFMCHADESREKVSEGDWTKLRILGLITEDEVEALSKHLRVQAAAVMMHWAARIVRECSAAAGLTSNVMRNLLDKLLAIREESQSTIDTVKFVIPFPYFHLLNLVLLVKLLILAYGYGLMNSIFAPVGYLVSSLIFCGVMELSSQLQDPFGLDDVDFPTGRWHFELMMTMNSIAHIAPDYPKDETNLPSSPSVPLITPNPSTRTWSKTLHRGPGSTNTMDDDDDDD